MIDRAKVEKVQSESDILAFLQLSRLRGVGPILIKRLLTALGSADAILNAHPGTLAAVEGIGTIKASQIVSSAMETEAPAREELARAQQAGLTLLTLEDPLYPPGLKKIDDPPLVLYVRGQLLPTDAVAVGIVGARECTMYGREQATRLAAQLAEAGLTVVSGGARGIDTCAHLGAIHAGGRTIVVQGCGLSHTYPPENVDLYRRIADENVGAILSELPLDAPPSRENFPPRNRIIAGMSLGILVVEANLRSGSLITARLAAADYGREVFALPGRIDSPASAGTHHLIKSATAHLVESAEDILAHLGDVGRILEQSRIVSREAPHENRAPDGIPGHSPQATLFPPKPPAAPLTTTQQQILSAFSPKGSTIDDLVESTSLPPQVIMAELTLLQIQGAISRLSGNRYARA
jgi:DNA processing protein